MKASSRRIGLLLAFAVLTALVVALVWRWRGVPQVGNALSFCGSLWSLWPTVQALRTSRRYTKAIDTPGPPEMAKLKQSAEKARRRRLLAFDAGQFALVVIGVGLMSTGFLLSILFAAPPPPPAR